MLSILFLLFLSPAALAIPALQHPTKYTQSDLAHSQLQEPPSEAAKFHGKRLTSTVDGHFNTTPPQDPSLFGLPNSGSAQVKFFEYAYPSYSTERLNALAEQSLDAIASLQAVRQANRSSLFHELEWSLIINNGMAINIFPPVTPSGGLAFRCTYGMIEDAIAALPAWGSLWEKRGLEPRTTYFNVVANGEEVALAFVNDKAHPISRPPSAMTNTQLPSTS